MSLFVPMEESLSLKADSESSRTFTDQSQFAAIYEKHSKPIYYLALRMLGDPSRAEDAAHDVFLKAFCSLDEFRGEAGLRTWLYQITINHCKNLAQTWHQRNVFSSADDNLFDGESAPVTNPLRVLMNWN